MGILIAGLVAIATLLLASSVLFSTFLSTSVSGAQSMKDMAQTNKERIGSALNITSAVFDGVGTRDMGVLVDNTGSQSVAQFGRMDVIVDYTDLSDNPVQTRLDYKDSGIGDNEWTVPITGVQPDGFNPGMWDSDESLFIDLKIEPQVKPGTSALVVVGTPWGVSDQTSVAAP